ncbi:MAG TPA: type II secretion system F family protein [Candidatus Nanoarchaeia archaeon]|nr:type II secretion system F family protein [Candidatus Nanoarchaeia archaeon]
MKDTPEAFVSKAAKAAFMLAALLTIACFFILSAAEKTLLLLLIIFPIVLFLSWAFMMHTPDVYIRKRERDIEKEVLFAGRFILVKIDSGVPFFSALSDAAQSHGAAGKYFAEIVHDIELGTPIEVALENAIENSPSEKFRRILWQVMNSLKTGIDVADTLRGILKQITDEQVIEIKEYGKKLNSLAMFYMLIGVIVPTLGITMFIILSSFLSITIPSQFLYFAAGILAFLQFMFISVFKSSRPMVDM